MLKEHRIGSIPRIRYGGGLLFPGYWPAELTCAMVIIGLQEGFLLVQEVSLAAVS